MSRDGTELIQLQQDRFSHNWRKAGTDLAQGAIYPRYERVREKFEQELDVFKAFVIREALGELRPTQCEIVYVNEIVATDDDLSTVLTLWNAQHDGVFLPPPDNVQLSVSYTISRSDGGPSGHLYVELQRAIRRADQRTVFLLSLAARGRPDGQAIGDVLGFLDLGHEWAVRGFAELTSTHMHKIWGRNDAS